MMILLSKCSGANCGARWQVRVVALTRAVPLPDREVRQRLQDRIIGGIRLLKSGGLVGAEAWETVVRW